MESQKLKNYIFQEKIGKGNFSEVWKVIDKNNYNVYAVKVLDDNQIKSQPKVLELLQSEIRILKTIDNVNVVKLYDNFVEKGRYYLIMEYCNNSDLEHYVKGKPNKCISEAEALGFFKQLLNGFKALHEIKAMHRDFKLANVLINDGVLKIADLGFSKQADLAKTALGTGVYMAPEIMKYQKYNNKVDIWSLGISLYEMLYGVFPFFGANEVELLKNVEKNIINFNEKGKSISPEFQSLIKNMLVVDPARRINWIDVYNHKLLNPEENGPVGAGLRGSVAMFMKKDDMDKQHQNVMFQKNKNFYEVQKNLEYDNEAYKKEEDTIVRPNKMKKPENSPEYIPDKNKNNKQKQKEEKKKPEKPESFSSDDEKKPPVQMAKKRNTYDKNKDDSDDGDDMKKKVLQEKLAKLLAEKKESMGLLENRHLHWRNIISQHARVLNDGLILNDNDNSIYIYFILAKRILFLSDEFSQVLEKKKNIFNEKFFEDFVDSRSFEKISTLFKDEKMIYEAYFESLLIDIKAYQTNENPLYKKLKGEFNNKIKNVEDLFKEILTDYLCTGVSRIGEYKSDKNQGGLKKFAIHLIELIDCYRFKESFAFDSKTDAGFNFEQYKESLEEMSLGELHKYLEKKFNSLF